MAITQVSPEENFKSYIEKALDNIVQQLSEAANNKDTIDYIIYRMDQLLTVVSQGTIIYNDIDDTLVVVIRIFLPFHFTFEKFRLSEINFRFLPSFPFDSSIYVDDCSSHVRRNLINNKKWTTKS